MMKQPCSWWPAEGEARPSKRHDKVALGGEQGIGPYDEESRHRIVTVPAMREKRAGAEPRHDGRSHGRREDLEDAAPKNLPVYREWNDHTVHRGTGEMKNANPHTTTVEMTGVPRHLGSADVPGLGFSGPR